MTILTAAEDRAIDLGRTGYTDHRILHVGVLVEEHTLVALAGTEEVTDDGVSLNLLHRTRHTNRTSRHRDGRSTQHISGLAAAIDTRQDMTASNRHVCVTLDGSCAAEVNTSTQCSVEVRHTTRAATEHVAVVRMTILGDIRTALGIFCKGSIIVILTVCRIQILRIGIVWCAA